MEELFSCDPTGTVRIVKTGDQFIMGLESFDLITVWSVCLTDRFSYRLRFNIYESDHNRL